MLKKIVKYSKSVDILVCKNKKNQHINYSINNNNKTENLKRFS